MLNLEELKSMDMPGLDGMDVEPAPKNRTDRD